MDASLVAAALGAASRESQAWFWIAVVAIFCIAIALIGRRGERPVDPGLGR